MHACMQLHTATRTLNVRFTLSSSSDTMSRSASARREWLVVARPHTAAAVVVATVKLWCDSLEGREGG